MKVSINWIKDFVDLDGVNIDELIGRFTMAVAEVEGVEHKGRDLSNVVTAKILSVDNETCFRYHRFCCRYSSTVEQRFCKP